MRSRPLTPAISSSRRLWTACWWLAFLGASVLRWRRDRRSWESNVVSGVVVRISQAWMPSWRQCCPERRHKRFSDHTTASLLVIGRGGTWICLSRSLLLSLSSVVEYVVLVVRVSLEWIVPLDPSAARVSSDGLRGGSEMGISWGKVAVR
jgi:hypothetical protein